MYVVTVLTAVVNIRNMSDRMEQLYNGAFANVETSQKLLGNINNVQRNMILLAATDGIKDRGGISYRHKETDRQCGNVCGGTDNRIYQRRRDSR